MHKFKDGSEVRIDRNKKHQYSYVGDKRSYASTTGVAAHIDTNSSGLIQWAVDLSLDSGDRKAHTKSAAESMAIGTSLHASIENYINDGTVDEADDVFILWLNQVGNHHIWEAAEVMVINQETGTGGTIDALSFSDPDTLMVWDWKTKKKESSYLNMKPILKDHAQIANYTRAFSNMGSDYNVNQSTAKIAYLCLDTQRVYIETVDIHNAYGLFQQSSGIYHSTRAYKKGVKLDGS